MKIATLTLNPCMDKTLYFHDAFQTGALNRPAYSVMNVGGKGINVARIYKRLGIYAVALGFCGEEMGGLLKKALEKEEIPMSFVKTQADTRICVKMIDADGICTEANEPGGPITAQEYDALKKKLLTFAAECSAEGAHGCLFIGGSIPDGLEKTAYHALIQLVADFPVRVILDADGLALKEGLRARPWLIKPNDFELSQLTGYEISGKDASARAVAAAKASRRIHAEYGTNVLCTLGKDGAVWTGDEGSFYVNAPRVTLKGFTGAGDTFLASFVFAYEKNGGEIESALCFASSAAAAKVELTGTEMPDKTLMMKYVEQVRASQLMI